MIMPHSALSPLILLSLFGAAALHANEALDVLEGRKDAADISLPVAPEGSEPASKVKRRITYPEHQWPPGPLDPFWQRSVIYANPENPYVQEVAITGMLEFQAAIGKTEISGSDSVTNDGTRTRRARLGARMRVFRNTDIEAQAEFAGESDYHGIERLSARTEIRPDTSVTYGKFRPRFTTEYLREAEELAYSDRSMLTNMLAPSRTLGVMLNYQRDDWEYGLGWFSNDADPYIPSIEGPGFISMNISRTSSEMTDGVPVRTKWSVDYIHHLDPGGSDAIPRYDIAGRRSANGNQLVSRNPQFRHLLTTGVSIESPRYGFDGDFTLGRGDSTVWGLTLSPNYWAIPGVLKIVGRYHYADSDDAGSLVATSGASADPFFDDSPFYIGDEYHSFYVGANWHIHRDRLVLMNGLEYGAMKDDSGAGFETDAWIWHTGLRASF